MSFAGKPFVHFLKQNNVGGAVDMPPASCLRAVYIDGYAAAHVERTERLRRYFSLSAGLVGRFSEIPFIFHWEGCG